MCELIIRIFLFEKNKVIVASQKKDMELKLCKKKT